MVFLGERLGLAQVVALAALFAGVVLVGPAGTPGAGPGRADDPRGDAAVGGRGRRSRGGCSGGEGVSVRLAATSRMALGALLIIGFLVVTGRIGAIAAFTVEQWAIVAATGPAAARLRDAPGTPRSSAPRPASSRPSSSAARSSPPCSRRCGPASCRRRRSRPASSCSPSAIAMAVWSGGPLPARPEVARVTDPDRRRRERSGRCLGTCAARTAAVRPLRVPAEPARPVRPGDRAAPCPSGSATGRPDPELRRIAQGFEGAWPYLELIAAENDVADPARPVRRRGVLAGQRAAARGRPAGAGTTTSTHRFKPRAAAASGRWLAEKAGSTSVVHHSFHVLEVLPRIGMIRGGLPADLVGVLERCLVRPGRDRGRERRRHSRSSCRRSSCATARSGSARRGASDSPPPTARGSATSCSPATTSRSTGTGCAAGSTSPRPPGCSR